jgi:hypothetical protein
MSRHAPIPDALIAAYDRRAFCELSEEAQAAAILDLRRRIDDRERTERGEAVADG